MSLIKRLLTIAFAVFSIWLIAAQPTATGAEWPAGQDPKAAKEEGIPVENQLVIARCSPCHKRDELGRLSRISYQRRTPEGWEHAIKRMVRLNGASLSPEDAKQIVKYLSKFHGLAPEESQPAFYEAERRIIDEEIPDENIRSSCALCHGVGRTISQRRSREEWDLLVNLHVGLFPFVTAEGFYRFRPPFGFPPPPETDNRHPVQRAIDYFAKKYPLMTPEWQAWRSNIRNPVLEGRWAITGYQAGRGQVYGEMLIERTQAEEEFSTRIDLRYVRDGSRVTRTGRSIVYAGYSWRGRSNGSGNNGPENVREAMLVSRDWRSMKGRWFWGSYDEFGFDVSLQRIGSEPMIAAASPAALKSPSSANRIIIYGANLPLDVKVSDISLGPGIAVERILSAQSDSITVEASVAAGATNGMHDVSLRQHIAKDAIAVFDRPDYIKIKPDAGLARLGGLKYPKQYQQFEAIAFNRGPDGAPQTADDVELGPVDVAWSIQEFPATYFDDDKKFVGVIDKNGLFSPAVEGPNPDRRNSKNNYGDIWVEASYRPDGSSNRGPVLKARAYLIVTLPLYVRWDTPELSK